MIPFPAAIWLVGIALAIMHASRHARGDYVRGRDKAVADAQVKAGPAKLGPSARKMVVRHHRAGWWARELRHGFPVVRTGFHAGWLAHQTTALHTKGLREEARTTHAETRASLAAAIRDHKARQAEAAAEYETVIVDDRPASGSRASVRAKLADVIPFAPRHVPVAEAPVPAAGTPAPPPGPYAPRPVPDPVPVPRCVACGRPARRGDPLVMTDRADVPVHHSHTLDPRDGFCAASIITPPAASPAPQPTEGASQQMATSTAETKYSVQMARTRARQGQAELRASIAKRKADEAEMAAADVDAALTVAIADAAAMEADELDGGTLGAQYELISRLRAEKDAAMAEAETARKAKATADATFEQAATVATTLGAHGGINQAVEDASVPAAKSGFYGAS